MIPITTYYSPRKAIVATAATAAAMLLSFQTVLVQSCSDFLVTPGASLDGSAMIAYNADDVGLNGVLYHYPATTNNDVHSNISIYEWDSGEYLGEIPQVKETFNVVGNGNEYGLVIGESTFGGIPILGRPLDPKNRGIDYGSLIYITLQRSKTAKEAIHTMVDLMDTHGYASEGESFSIADASGEVWIMEVIGRGPTFGKMGAVWVARRVPDGYVTAHANQARITTFPRDDAETCLYADDVIDVAVHYGLYSKAADPAAFSFSDVYDPVGFSGARFSDARVWSMFSQIADEDGSFQIQYQDYASGQNLTNRMPLFIKPHKKLDVRDVMDLMNSHYDGTGLDSSHDVGAGLFGAPYRPRPLEWTFGEMRYFNERTVAIEKTGWNFVAQIRPHMPRELAALIWFGVDDSSTSPRLPVYASSKMVPEAYAGKGTQDGVKFDIFKFDMKKAFWIQNLVSNFAYSRWNDCYPTVRHKIDEIHAAFAYQVAHVDAKALDLYKKQDASVAVDFVTMFTAEAGEDLQREWTAFFGDLFTRFRDFSIILPDPDSSRGFTIESPGLSEEVKRRIVMETGTRYQVRQQYGETPGLRWGGQATEVLVKAY
ncbi:peptidase U34 dipeptidase family protein [Nitzschia inconspicua]|uniref:Peptidase U34 dipeptidase family protein n=1 Tax=Nitzschia inconspicua TaxID=303405 RepID=A0A9K3LEV3_9STRA|nr:peptidase U34 dipeptidase family protein [Nitzschia inconspicua]